MSEQTNIYKVPQPPKKDYHSLPGLSNSRLKTLDKSPVLFKQMQEHGWGEPQKKHHEVGTMIDLMLLDYEKFNDSYVLQTWETPSSSNQIEFAEKVAEGMPIEKAYDSSYASNYKPDTLKRKADELYKELKGYIDYLSLFRDRTPYTLEQQEMLQAMQNNCFNHPKIGVLLNADNAQHHVIFQENLLGEPFKCEVDWYIDTGNVVWNIDLKSTKSHLAYFPGEYRKYGYNKQQALYYKLIRKKLNDQGRHDTVIQTACIAVSKQFPYEALLFRPHPKLLVQGWQWIREKTELYKFHKKNGFDYPKRTYEKGNEIIYPYDFDYSLLEED